MAMLIFDTLVTKFWAINDFDQGQNKKDRSKVFQNFARYCLHEIKIKSNK